MIFTGNISEDGKMTIVNRKDFDAYVSQFSGKQVTIDVRKKISKRSNPQNAYYHACVVPIMQQAFKDLGYRLSREETHLVLRQRFLKNDIINEDGEVIAQTIVSTTTLTKSQFNDYLAEITQFAAEYFNVQIPEPNEQLNLINQ